ncbi:unnamed protein product, partial [Discosporangium mesarthrocarpum]
SKSRGCGVPGERLDLEELDEAYIILTKAGEICADTRPALLASLQASLTPLLALPVASLGILCWIHAQVSNDQFCLTPSFLSYAPVFLKLCTQAAHNHPPQRPSIFEVIKLILHVKTAPDTPQASRAKAGLKHQAINSMTYMMATGYTLPVVEYLGTWADEVAHNHTKNQQQSLVVYFLQKALEILGPREVGEEMSCRCYPGQHQCVTSRVVLNHLPVGSILRVPISSVLGGKDGAALERVGEGPRYIN